MTGRGRYAAPAECGTDSGYHRHLKVTRTEVCGPCRDAHNAAESARRARRVPCGQCGAPMPSRRRDELCAGCAQVARQEARRLEREAAAEARRQARAAKCGTDGGYFRHLRGVVGVRPSVPCQACVDAHSAAERARKQARTGRVVQPLNKRVKKRRVTDPVYVRRGLVLVPVHNEREAS